MKSRIMELLKDKKSVVVFDVDGVLAAYEYGERNHNACLDSEWDEYLKTNDAYAKARPLVTLQRFLAEYKSRDQIFACTQAANEKEFEKKAAFVVRNYPIDRENIYMVESKPDKLNMLRKIHKEFFADLDEQYIIMVDDTIAVLTNIQENSGYSTAHITSFIE